MNGRIAALIVLTLTLHLSAFAQMPLPHKPDASATPGSLCDVRDPDFRGYRYEQKVAYCHRNVEPGLKSYIYELYGVRKAVRKEYTIDHFIPLSIGGSNQIENLWPEHRKIKQLRINLETEVFEAVRDGLMTQQEAIDKIIKAKMNPPLSNENEI